MKTIDLTQIKLTLCIFGHHFNPTELSDILQITPTEICIIGDVIPEQKNISHKSKIFRRKETSWEYSIGYTPTLHFDELAQQLVDMFNPKINILKNFILVNNLTVKIFIVPKIERNGTPGFYFDRPFLNLVHVLDAVIDMDTYIMY